ncbi:MAG: NOB1 family endonuclease [Candidatus Bathyarchaeia archaeon]
MTSPFEVKRAIVLDTSALVAGFDPFSISEEQYTVPLVREELKGNALTRVRLNTAIERGKIIIRKPEKTFLDIVKTSATVVGDKFSLSEADLQVLALALELKDQGYSPLIASDDYSIQNVANHMGIDFASLATFGIRFQLEWIRYCPACHRKYPADYKLRTCEVCGTELKRKPLRKRNLHR